MRRISLAVALIGAFAATGCGGGAKPAADTAGAKGTAGVNFNVTVNNQGGGTVSDGTQTCAADTTCTWTYASGTPVTLTATQGSLYFNGWFGDCQGTGTCTLAGQADQYVVSYFSAKPEAHPNFNDPKLHAPAYFSQTALVCTDCHGAQLQGTGIAPSCNQCHDFALVPSAAPLATGVNTAVWGTTTNTDHFNFTLSGCGPCHSSTSILTSAPFGFTAAQAAAMLAGAPAALPYTCVTCHNSKSDPVWGTGITSLTFPGTGNATITTSKVIGLCGQCHLGRASGKSVITTVAPPKVNGIFNITSSVDPHFFTAAAVMMGSNANAAYQYGTNTYASYAPFYNAPGNTAGNPVGGAPGPHGSPHGADCTTCHSANGNVHFQKVDLANTKVPAPYAGYKHGSGAYPADGEACDACHSSGPYGRSLEAVRANVGALSAQLLAKLNTYLVAGSQSPICFKFPDPNHRNFYKTTSAIGTGGGLCGASDNTASTNSYNTWDPKAYQAAFNLAVVQMDPGAYAHNGDYATQAVIDSILDLDSAAVLPCDAAPKSGSAYANDASCKAAQLYNGTFTADGNPGYAGTAIPRP